MLANVREQGMGIKKKKLGRGSINSPLYNGGSMNLHVRPIVNPLNLRAASHVIEIVLVAL